MIFPAQPCTLYPCTGMAYSIDKLYTRECSHLPLYVSWSVINVLLFILVAYFGFRREVSRLMFCIVLSITYWACIYAITKYQTFYLQFDITEFEMYCSITQLKQFNCHTTQQYGGTLCVEHHNWDISYWSLAILGNGKSGKQPCGLNDAVIYVISMQWTPRPLPTFIAMNILRNMKADHENQYAWFLVTMGGLNKYKWGILESRFI